MNLIMYLIKQLVLVIDSRIIRRNLLVILWRKVLVEVWGRDRERDRGVKIGGVGRKERCLCVVGYFIRVAWKKMGRFQIWKGIL